MNFIYICLLFTQKNLNIMGVDLTVKLGPYLEVVGTKETIKTVIKRQCPNHPTKKTEDKFCSLCGSEIQNIETSKSVKKTPSDVFNGREDFEDKLFSPEYLDNIFLPNDTVPKELRVDTDNNSPIDISSKLDIINQQIEWFDKTYTAIIHLMCDEFGDDNVHVRWGVVTYWS